MKKAGTFLVKTRKRKTRNRCSHHRVAIILGIIQAVLTHHLGQATAQHCLVGPVIFLDIVETHIAEFLQECFGIDLFGALTKNLHGNLGHFEIH
jgi:hypothetical protein